MPMPPLSNFPEIRDQFTHAPDGARIHFLDNESNSKDNLPLVIVSGMLGIADHYRNELKALAPNRVIAISHRGLGKSGPISAGKATFAHRVSDIGAVTRYLGLKKYVLYAFSRGVALAVAHGLANLGSIEAMVLHDCEPTYIRPSE